MNKHKSGNVNNSSSNETFGYIKQQNEKSFYEMNSSGLENKKVEPKKVKSDFFDSDEENKSKSAEKSKIEDKSVEDFSQIMRELRSRHNLKFKSPNTSMHSSKPNETKLKEKSKLKEGSKMKMSGLFNNLFKELSEGEKMCNDTYDKVNQQSEVGC